MKFITNLSDFPTIEIIQNLEIKEGDILSISKKDVSGFSFGLLFRIIKVKGDFLQLEPLMPIYAQSI